MLLWTLECLRLLCYIFWISVSGFLGYNPSNGIAGPKVSSIFLFFEAISFCFSQWLHQSAFPPTVYEGSCFSTTSPALAVCWFVYDGHSDRCEVVSHVVLTCISLRGWWCRAFFHVSMGSLSVSLGGVSVLAEILNRILANQIKQNVTVIQLWFNNLQFINLIIMLAK